MTHKLFCKKCKDITDHQKFCSEVKCVVCGSMSYRMDAEDATEKFLKESPFVEFKEENYTFIATPIKKKKKQEIVVA